MMCTFPANGVVSDMPVERLVNALLWLVWAAGLIGGGFCLGMAACFRRHVRPARSEVHFLRLVLMRFAAQHPEDREMILKLLAEVIKIVPKAPGERPS
jgi:hypothetical protein